MSDSYIHSRLTIIVSAVVVFLCIILFPVYKLINFHVHYQTELKKCPICIGSNMCNCFINNKFRLNWDYFWTNFLNICLKKNLIFGSCGSQMVVLKWVRDDKGFQSSRPAGLHYTEDDSDIDKILQSMLRLSKFNTLHTLGADFVLCPSTEKLGSLLRPIVDGIRPKPTPRIELYNNLFYSVQVNMEPIIQQALSWKMDQIPAFKTLGVCVLHFSRVIAEVRNNFLIRNLSSIILTIKITSEWAVARYLGACGDISVSEYCGHTLTSVFPGLTWGQRSSVAKQLLRFAFNATFDNPAFAFYFTDLSPDNFAVSDNGVIRLVDLDNVIIVDKDPTVFPDFDSRNMPLEALLIGPMLTAYRAERSILARVRWLDAGVAARLYDAPDNWDTEHTSYHDENIGGFAFSTEEMCSHRISDTNIYSICQGILSANSDLLPGGLLHSAPPHLTGLKRLVEDCTSPPADQTRFDFAQSILQVLDEMAGG